MGISVKSLSYLSESKLWFLFLFKDSWNVGFWNGKAVTWVHQCSRRGSGHLFDFWLKRKELNIFLYWLHLCRHYCQCLQQGALEHLSPLLGCLWEAETDAWRQGVTTTSVVCMLWREVSSLQIPGRLKKFKAHKWEWVGLFFPCRRKACYELTVPAGWWARASRVFPDIVWALSQGQMHWVGVYTASNCAFL